MNKPFRVFDAADLTQKIAFYQAESLTEKDEKKLQIVTILPDSERHLRPLIASLKTDSERIAVWQNAVYWVLIKKINRQSTVSSRV